MTIDQVKNLAAVIGAAVALLAFIKGVLEYSRQGAQRRAEYFLNIRKRLKENQSFKEICALLEVDDPRLRQIDFKEKRDFLGLFEEVAIMLNSGLIRKPVAHYMFGYYAILCWKSEKFWSDVNRNTIYWSLFRDFVQRMEVVKSSFKFRRRRYRF